MFKVQIAGRESIGTMPRARIFGKDQNAAFTRPADSLALNGRVNAAFRGSEMYPRASTSSYEEIWIGHRSKELRSALSVPGVFNRQFLSTVERLAGRGMRRIQL